jgi:hypothetical protein
MSWETPTFVEINMSAEIGGYQSDFGDREPVGPGPVASAACGHDEPPAASPR